jgi:hypothetical protein
MALGIISYSWHYLPVCEGGPSAAGVVVVIAATLLFLDQLPSTESHPLVNSVFAWVWDEACGCIISIISCFELGGAGPSSTTAHL